MTMTIVPSPKSILQEEWLSTHPLPIRRPASVTASTWLGYRFHIGDVIREKDGRHLARIDRIRSSTWADVTYVDTGWLGTLYMTDIEHAPTE